MLEHWQYKNNAELVTKAIQIIQPRGTRWDTNKDHWDRAAIALDIHHASMQEARQQ